MRIARLAVAVLAVSAGAARANDSTAVFASGGLVLTSTDAVALVAEDLRIARDDIRVRYTFENRTDGAVESLVAFPLPDIDLATYTEVPVNQPTDDPVNFVGFTVVVDDQTITPELHASASLRGEDVTGVLAGLGIPISLFADDLHQRLWDLPRADQDALQARELAFFERDYGAVYPQWTQHVGFTWNQVFPAGRPIRVEHRYAPVVGTRFISVYTLDGDHETAFRARYCMDEHREAIAARLEALEGTPSEGLLVADEIGYVLSTGANWAGPIGTLDLTIDGGDPGNLVLTCFEGLTREGTSRLTGRWTDFVPTTDIWVLVIRANPES